jgi:hypothetical protein
MDEHQADQELDEEWMSAFQHHMGQAFSAFMEMGQGTCRVDVARIAIEAFCGSLLKFSHAMVDGTPEELEAMIMRLTAFLRSDEPEEMLRMRRDIRAHKE